uniref:Uncharacterized protein n=1 Tax=Picea glauca TaxID=3330 RepID=A0A117NHZ9_PICGL|nr:hypothetical protein ABT39_MTgene3726 [Picea glauca]
MAMTKVISYMSTRRASGAFYADIICFLYRILKLLVAFLKPLWFSNRIWFPVTVSKLIPNSFLNCFSKTARLTLFH